MFSHKHYYKKYRIHISLLFFNNLDILKVRKPGRPTEYIYNVSILNNKQSDLVKL